MNISTYFGLIRASHNTYKYTLQASNGTPIDPTAHGCKRNEMRISFHQAIDNADNQLKSCCRFSYTSSSSFFLSFHLCSQQQQQRNGIINRGGILLATRVRHTSTNRVSNAHHSAAACPRSGARVYLCECLDYLKKKMNTQRQSDGLWVQIVGIYW